MSRHITKPDIFERVKYLAEMLVELDEMAKDLELSELSLLIGTAAIAAMELEENLSPVIYKEMT